jgi:5-hydroxyisourate hydrolase
MSQVTTHVLDLATGRPAAGIAVALERAAGVYQLRFDTGRYQSGKGFFPEVTIAFRVEDREQHYHVPLLLGPWSYSTYRGS